MSEVYFKIQEDPPNQRGPLRKQGKRTAFWVKRWYRTEWDSVTMQPSLVVYEKETMGEKHSSISLTQCHVSSRPDKDVLTAKGGPAYCFELDTRHAKDGRDFLLYASSEEEREDWLHTLYWCCLNCNVENIYEIDRSEGHLGQGSFSTVWRGVHRQSGRAWALKEIEKKELKFVEEENLREEIRIQRLVGEHANIVYMKEFAETWDKYVLVIDLLERGALLDRIMDAGKFTEKDALYIMKQLLNAIQYLHSKKIVHRDLKPENFLLTDEPASRAAEVGSTFAFRVCIGDFGLASYCAEADSLHALCGSPGYVAPEIIRQKEGYGLPVDMWSLGVNLYILLTGVPPFAGNNDKESFALTVKGSIKWSVLHDCSPTLRDLVAKLLEYSPGKRITADAALQHPWMKGEGVGDRQLRIKDNLRTFTSSVKDSTTAVTEGVLRGFGTMFKSVAALTTSKPSTELPSASWMGGHGRTTSKRASVSATQSSRGAADDEGW